MQRIRYVQVRRILISHPAKIGKGGVALAKRSAQFTVKLIVVLADGVAASELLTV